MIEGIEIQMKGRNFTVPSLNLKSVRKLQPQLNKLSTVGTTNEERLDIMLEAIVMALRRNYSLEELSIEEIEDMLDLGNMNRVFDAVMAVSGMVKTTGE